MARTKFCEQFCGHCNKKTRMEIIGEMQDTKDKVWLRCTRCHHMNLITISEKEQKPQNTKLDINTATLYSPEQCFRIGEAIFHQEWNDVGKVLGKVKTSDGNQAIIVSFEKQGEKKLIESFKPETQTIMENTN